VKLAIIGNAFSGKTTVFNALTGANEPLSDFSGGGAEHRREVGVPDPRLAKLAEDYQPKKITPARMEFLDLPAYGGNDKFFGDIRQMEGFIRVCRAFKTDAVPHPKQRTGYPAAWKSDAADLDADFVIQDLTMVERRIEKLEKSSKKPTPNQKLELEELAIMQKVRPSLEEGVPLKKSLPPEDQAKLRPYGFLTLKPILTLVNVDDDQDPAALGLPPLPDLGKGPVDDLFIPIKARLEAEVAQLDEADKKTFLADFGLAEPIRDVVVRLSYALLGLHSFLTAGEKEVRAWTIKKGASAVEAAKVIHSDIAKNFIRAEIVGWDDYVANGGWKEAKNKNKMRLEGKDYVMRDGDVVEFRHAG
jgi:GTP-binding protein YchF